MGSGFRSAGRADRVRQSLLSEIEAGTLRVGDRTMPLRELASHMGVAYVTARKAVQGLCREGVLETRRGADRARAQAHRFRCAPHGEPHYS